MPIQLRTRKIRYSEACSTPEAALSYSTKYHKAFHKRISNSRERRLLNRIFSRIGPVEKVLDMPSGPGRLSDLITGWAGQVCEVDYSRDMVKLLRSNGKSCVSRFGVATAFHLPFRDRSFDLAVSIRLSHHIPDLEGRLWHLRELFRVSDGYVLVTFFDSGSLKNRLRELHRSLGSQKRGKYTLSRYEVRSLASKHGFAPARFWRLSFVLSGHTFGLLRRIGSSSSGG